MDPVRIEMLKCSGCVLSSSANTLFNEHGETLLGEAEKRLMRVDEHRWATL